MTNLNLLKERITLLSIECCSDSNGKEKIIQNCEGFSWAHIAPIHRIGQKYVMLAMGLTQNITKPVYKVLIRERSDLEKKAHLNGRHLKINALRWKHKEFELLCPFILSDRANRFWETLCIEKGEVHG